MIGDEVKEGGPPAPHPSMLGLVSYSKDGGFYSEGHEDPLQIFELMSSMF